MDAWTDDFGELALDRMTRRPSRFALACLGFLLVTILAG